MMHVGENIQKLHKYMSEEGLYGYIIPTDDPHMSEYPPSHYKRREFISQFTGSAGTVLVTHDKALLWTDGRYFLQADTELGSEWALMKMGLPETPTLDAWLYENAPQPCKVGVDPFTYTPSQEQRLRAVLSEVGIELVLTEGKNLVDKVWENQPPLPLNKIRLHPVEYAGASVQQKLEKIRHTIKAAKSEYLVITLLDEIAYLFNLRGSDIEYNPVFVSYAIVSLEQAIIYVNPEKVKGEVEKYLKQNHVIVQPYETILSDIEQLGKEGKKVWMDPEKVNVALLNTYKKAFQSNNKENSGDLGRHITKNPSPVYNMKAVKNEVELQGMRQAHKLDAVALCNAFCEIDHLINDGNHLSELQIDEICTTYRKKQLGFVELSFPTIAGEGPNGAIIHYRPQEKSSRQVTRDSILLVDSGAQFDCGTTDITRTMHFGEPSVRQKEAFTLVLKGNINLAMATFPEGTTGLQLDVLARKPLWSQGLNYLHGTGHGVGAALNVHEGPQSISTRFINYPLQGGMVVSNEPGFYEPNCFGIRIENLLIIKPVKTRYNFNDTQYYGFETLTLVPIQTRMVVPEMLSQQEKDYLNGYHNMVWEHIQAQVDERTKQWLKAHTQPIS